MKKLGLPLGVVVAFVFICFTVSRVGEGDVRKGLVILAFLYTLANGIGAAYYFWTLDIKLLLIKAARITLVPTFVAAIVTLFTVKFLHWPHPFITFTAFHIIYTLISSRNAVDAN